MLLLLFFWRKKITFYIFELKCQYNNLLLFIIGDEIYTINGNPVQDMTHSEAIGLFKEVKQGELVVVIGRRTLLKKKVVNFDNEQ